jgi:phosphoribosyl 1,2-cyclic phosphate phosphodiesterase
MRVTVLGCGGSAGVPVLGSGWGACDPNEPRNRRRRCSILLQHAGKTILVDASPDLREQLLDAEIGKVDAILLTHAHADHIHGMDDLRPFYWAHKEIMPMYGDVRTLTEVQERFGYMFAKSKDSPPHFVPPLSAHVIAEDAPLNLIGLDILPFRQDHGVSGESLGFLFGGRFVYSTDVQHLSDDQLDWLASLKLDLWIVDALRLQPATAHANLEKTLSWIERVKPARALLTHMAAPMDYALVSSMCPPGTSPAHDGLVIDIALS